MVQAAISLLPFFLSLFSCIALAWVVYWQLALTYTVLRTARIASIGTTVDDTFSNHINRTIPSTPALKLELVNHGRIFGLFPNSIDQTTAIRICRWDPMMTAAPDLNCAVEAPQLVQGDFFTISVRHPLSLAFIPFKVPANSSILGKIE